MAKTRSHALTDLKGKIGRLVFYELNGKPCVREVPVREEPFRPGELKSQSRFKLASKFAAAVLTDPIQRARYEQIAQKNHRSANNVAVSDFLRAPTLAEIDLSQYTGCSGQVIKVIAVEGDIGAAEVKITVADGAQNTLEEGFAWKEATGNTWFYETRVDLAPNQPLWITVMATDQPGNRTTRTLRHTSGN
jgi:hypothetical protein